MRETLELGHNYIGIEHVLLGLTRESDGNAAQVFTHLGIDSASEARPVSGLRQRLDIARVLDRVRQLRRACRQR